ncbi:hypothetical protein [Nostoc sp.]
MQSNFAPYKPPQRLTVRVATGASTRATLRGNTLYLMPNVDD